MRSTTIALLGFLTAVASASAGAQTTQPATAPGAPTPVPVPRTTFIATMDTEFRKMDADHNNILTKKEVEDYARAMSAIAADNRRRALFAALDADHNGVLTPAEFAKLQLPASAINADTILSQTDINHDGQITLVEYRTGKLANFDRMDADKDGVVSPAEMRAVGLIRQ